MPSLTIRRLPTWATALLAVAVLAAATLATTVIVAPPAKATACSGPFPFVALSQDTPASGATTAAINVWQTVAGPVNAWAYSWRLGEWVRDTSMTLAIESNFALGETRVRIRNLRANGKSAFYGHALFTWRDPVSGLNRVHDLGAVTSIVAGSEWCSYTTYANWATGRVHGSMSYKLNGLGFSAALAAPNA